MTVPRAFHTATLFPDGRVLIARGHQVNFPNSALAGAGDMTDARGAHTATMLPGGTVLIAGGFTAFPFLGKTLASAEIYDPSTGSFTPTASMSAARGRQAGASLPNGDVLVAGGID